MTTDDEWGQVPANITAERNVLGAMMLREDVIPEVFMLLSTQRTEDPDHRFYRPAHRVIYQAIIDIWDRGGSPDATLVAARLQEEGNLTRVGGTPYLFELIEQVPSTSNAVEYARLVVETWRERITIDLGKQILQSKKPDEIPTLIERWNYLNSLTTGNGPAPKWAEQFVTGGTFILDQPPTPTAVWGDDQTVGWAEGESLMIVGPPGVGKTTLVVQLVAARLGVQKEVLGLPVQPSNRKVLYLAMDRPPQIARAMGRVFGDDLRSVLDERLVLWKGPPPGDFARNTGLLAQMCEAADADTVVVDSLKDAVLKLSDDESGSGYNMARQNALVEGVQVVELHHQRKASGENKKPSKLDDVYGSVWLTSGAGSVMCLWGQAGDPIVELLHLKQPMEPLGPWQIVHDHNTGHSSIHHQADLLTLARHQGVVGLTPQLAAQQLFSTEKPTPNEIEKARRKLDKHVRDGFLTRRDGVRGGAPAAYFLVIDERREGA